MSKNQPNLNKKIVKTKIENNKIPALSILRKINLHLDIKRKKDVKVVLFLSVLSSIAESVSIAMLVPFISFFQTIFKFYLYIPV